MNARHKRFVAEYLKDLKATKAYIRAGYSEKGAAQGAERLLRNVDIRAAVAAGQARLAEKAGVTAEKIVAELAKLGFSNMDDFVRRTADGEIYTDFSAADRDKMAAVHEVTVETYTEGRGDDAKDVKRVKFKLADKRASLVDLGKHLGMFVEKIEHSGSVDVNSTISSMRERARSLRAAR